MKLSYKIIGDEVRAYINEDEYYCTNSDGEGLFKVCISRNSRTQLIGTWDFSTRRLKDESKKAKLRKMIQG